MLDLQASISRADGARVHRYLPLGVPKAARDYVRESVVQGTATGAKFRVKGDLRDFPFKNPRQGEFRITAEVRDVTYAFVPRQRDHGRPSAWPALTQLSGELVFERNGMQVKGAAGHFAGAPRLQVKADAQIADFQATTVARHRRRARAAGRGAGRGQQLAAFRDDRPCAGQGQRQRQCRRAAEAGAAGRDIWTSRRCRAA